ncbi:hypothetical protein PybrP1_000672 [[Pythium] brassicae (nom. inval.)]|nr:hypothetical protein PybrP1_000672 [[Pythium] brassicae (nom. inval.)]
MHMVGMKKAAALLLRPRHAPHARALNLRCGQHSTHVQPRRAAQVLSWPLRSLSTATPSAASTASPTVPAAAAASSAAPAPTAADDVDNVKIDLSTVGAETSRVLTIADVLTSREQSGAAGLFEEWESISGSRSVHDAVELMVKFNMRSLIVTEENAGIVGMVTERDVLRKTSPRTILTQETQVRDIMSSHIIALATMTKENIRHMAVINGELSNTVKIGSVPEEAMRCVLSIKDIVKAYAEFEAEKKQLRQHAQADGAASSEGEGGASSGANAADAKPADGAATEPANTPAAAVPAVTAATLLKKKHKKIKLILNTREEDHISVADAVEAMARQNFGAVLIVDKEQRVLGIFTERDYLAKVVFYKEDPAAVRMADVSTRNVQCLQIEDSLEKCWSQAATQDFRHFPVVGVMRKGREKELAGILSIKDIVREIAKEHRTTPGFRLMEFFKSKMEPAAPAPVAPAAPPADAAPSSSPPKPSAPVTSSV